MTIMNIQVSDDTLERLSERAFTFLSAVSNVPAVREKLAARGYTAAVHQQGWALVDEVSGRVSVAPAAPVERDEKVDEALDEVDAWDETNLAVARAALQHRFTVQYDYLFANNLQAVRGRGAVLAVMTFLRRLDDLEKSPARAATRAQDHAALELLAQRGITAKERAHMATLVARVQQGVAAAAPVAQTDDAQASKRKGKAAEVTTPPTSTTPTRLKKVELYVWFSEWSGVARAVIKQRKLLIRLGLASPRRSKADDVVTPAPTPSAPPR